MASGGPQATTRGGAGRRRQGGGQPSAGGKEKTGGSPALRPLDELRAEWLRRRARVGNDKEGGQRRRAQGPRAEASSTRNDTDAGAALLRMLKAGPGPNNVAAEAKPQDKKDRERDRREDQWHDKRREKAEAAIAACEAAESAEGSATSPVPIDVVLDPQSGDEETRHERGTFLSTRPAIGDRPKGLPRVLAMPREIAAVAGDHRHSEDGEKRRSGRSEEKREEKRAEKAGLDPLQLTGAEDEFCFVDDEEEEEAREEDEGSGDQPRGIEESRGFSKWFGAGHGKSMRRKDAGEAGLSTDAGSDEESSDDLEGEPVLSASSGVSMQARRGE